MRSFGPTSRRHVRGETMLQHLLVALLLRVDQAPPLVDGQSLLPHPVARAFVDLVERGEVPA